MKLNGKHGKGILILAVVAGLALVLFFDGSVPGFGNGSAATTVTIYYSDGIPRKWGQHLLL